MPTPKKTTLRSDRKSVKINVPCKRCFLVIRLPQNMESPEKNQDVREFSGWTVSLSHKKKHVRKQMKPNWMSRELPMSWMSCICRKNAAPCSSLNAYPFPAFWGKKPRGFSEAKKPSFQLKNFGMSKKNHRLDVAISWTAELIWV